MTVAELFADSIFSEVLWWLCNLRQVISVELLHNLTKTLVTVVLLVPHVFVVSDLPILIQSQCNQAVHLLGDRHWLWCIFLLQLENDLIWL